MSSEEKSEEPTSRKLKDAFKRGDVTYSKDLTGAASFVAVLLTLWFTWQWVAQHLEAVLGAALGLVRSDDMSRDMMGTMVQMLLDMVWICLPVLIAVVVIATLIGLLQTRGAFSAEPMKPDFQRLHPGQAIQNLFSSQQAMEPVKMLLKLGLVMAVLFFVLKANLASLITSIYAGHKSVVLVTVYCLAVLFAAAGLVFVVIGIIDYGHRFYEFIKKNRMTKTELKHQNKDNYGDPHVRSELRALRKQLAQSGGKRGLENASVVVTNPTHFAVALYYEPGVVELPLVVAKGSDNEALDIRLEARRRGIPIMENPPLARSLFRMVAPGEPIANEHVDAVAEVFLWLKKLRSNKAIA